MRAESQLPSDVNASDSPLDTSTLRLPDFLDTPLLEMAYTAAASNDIDTLRALFLRHPRGLDPQRLDILETIPLFSDIVEYTDLLPKFDARADKEVEQHGRPWRIDTPEWLSEPIVKKLLGSEVHEWVPASAQQLANWYIARVEEMDEATGQVDNALSLVQYGAAQGIPGLDALGEQLSLLSRLVYDRRSASSAIANQQAWSLKKWQQASESDIVDAYLSQSTPTTIAQDIRTQVLPYLYVLESQREREGRPDSSLHDTMLFDWMLRASASSSPDKLEAIAAIFQASKPTLATGQRIIRSNEDLARLALACCYGHPGTSTASTQAMLQIFDCLPSFEGVGETTTSPQALQTLLSVISRAPGSSPSSSPLTPRDLFNGMKDWPVIALSRALDTLDLHLEAAEIFQRWNTPVTLQFFVSLSADEKAQRLWADRLAKTSPAAVSKTGLQGRVGQDFEDEDEWISLLDDLCKLGGKTHYSEIDPRPAFSALSQQEITKIFFGGLLSSAKFGLARSLFQPSSGERPLDASTEQALVLAASREYYDNADSGNLNSGNMKLAFDCLAVAPNTPEIRRERDFIEATSRLSSFNVLNKLGQPLTPIEIRLTTDKLELISRLLASNEDAYRHPDVILELVAKLGYRGDPLAETRVLSMLADAALQASDTKRAGDVCERMVKAVEQIRRSRDRDKAAQAADLAWKTCYQFGRRADTNETARKKELLGQALLLCPPANMHEVLSVWQVVDTAAVPRQATSPRRKHNPPVSHTTLGNSLSLPFSLPSRPTTPTTAAFSHSAESAARAAFSVGKAASSYLPFWTGTPENHPERSMSPSSIFGGRSDRPSSAGSRTGQSPARDGHMRNALESKLKLGVGWLLGADEEDL
ncbi:hypothetical protein P389DRAFT_140078 [Cystobasidium minutum MCA 4210]|uniref:uncharacterized protein n=1 Tax=Cystobasidium minutum MCA 4210 TaxID=1397322 RepID=UPI0034CE2AE3|eukprot:jgi/Rhomi1/140078/e_gw1.1.909.1